MRHQHQSTSPSSTPLANAFAPDYLARLREQEEILTAAEAELAGPWKTEAVPGKPGAVAVLRTWEDLAAGDRPVAVWWHEERARLLTLLLPALDREPLFHLVDGETADGYPVLAVYGEQGPRSLAGSTGTIRGGPRVSTSSRRSFGRLSLWPPCSPPPDREPRSRWAGSAPGSSSRKEEGQGAAPERRPLPALGGRHKPSRYRH